jgi:Fe2+ transport system protein FeoA
VPDRERRLSELGPGTRARLLRCELPAAEGGLLAAMGLTAGCRLEVRKPGDPLIVQVRSTRIGLASKLAHAIVVRAEDPTPR